MSNKPSKEDFKDWKANPITKWVIEELELMAEDYSKAIGHGASYDVNSIEKTALKTAESVGFISGLRALSELEIKE